MITVEGLTKQFAGVSTLAVDDVSFTVKPGEIFGLLGPNGAGKTTTLRMLCTLLKPSAGFAEVAGHDVVQNPDLVRRNIGFLSTNTGTYDRMTAREMLYYYGQLYDLPGSQIDTQITNLADHLQMNDFLDTRTGKLSTGQKQKVSIARALLHEPPVLIFDEPTTGLDVLVQRAVIQTISELRGRGKTVLFSSHILTEVEKLCDRIAVMAKGKVAAMGTIEELKEQFHTTDLEEVFMSLVA